MNTDRNDLLVESERRLGVRNGRSGGLMTRRQALELGAVVFIAWALLFGIFILAQWIGG